MFNSENYSVSTDKILSISAIVIALASIESKVIARIEFRETDDREKLVQENYSRVNIEIEYESMYGESFICKNKTD